MATFSNNIRVNAAVANSTTSTAAVTLYTAPSNGYAILNARTEGTRIINVGGISVGSTVDKIIYVGPSQVIQAAASGAGSFAAVTGVEFINSV